MGWMGWVICVLLICVLFLLALIGGYLFSWKWTGFGAYTVLKTPGRKNVHYKTLWDWIQLALIPFVVAFGVWELNRRREDLTRELQETRTREEMLQNYFDRMAVLMLDKGLRLSKSDSESRDIARARTLTVLRGLDGEGKATLLRFLSEANLIIKEKPVIKLEGT